MFEVELKARISSISELYNYLVKQLGFRAIKYSAEDHYFNHPCRDFAESDEELRVRIEKKGSESDVVLTYKGSMILDDRSAREEIEVRTGRKIIKILSNLGFTIDAFKRKSGWFLWRDDIEVVLCSVQGVYRNKAFSLGNYVEVEIKVKSREEIKEARKRIYDFLNKLPGIIEIDREYYLEKMRKLAKQN